MQLSVRVWVDKDQGVFGSRPIKHEAPPRVAVLLRQALFEKITITQDTRRPRVSKLEAMLQQLANHASGGDLSASRSMFRLLSELERREAEAANKPKPAPRHIIELPHNYRHPVDPQRLVLQKELSELDREARFARDGFSLSPELPAWSLPAK
jgi:hypothetical protein